LINWIRGTVLPAGKISPADPDLLSVTDDVNEVVSLIDASAQQQSEQEVTEHLAEQQGRLAGASDAQ
jgi:predicted Rossmann-fold nucleotide-binding protein